MTKKKNSLIKLSEPEFFGLKKEFFNSIKVQKYFQKIKSSLISPKNFLNKTETDMLQKIVEEEIRRQVETICFIQYAIMQRTNNWTEVGRERILHSLTRMFQNIGNEEPLNFELLIQTQEFLNDRIRAYKNIGLAELENKEQYLTIDLGWRKFRFSHYKIINNFLEIIGSKQRLILGQLELYNAIIFGKATVSQYAQLIVYTFHQESIHTPAIITSIAGMIKEKEIIIREDSAKTIFYNKWLTTFQQIKSPELKDLLKNRAENATLAFKLKTLLNYQTLTEKKLLQKKNLFIKEILEGLLWHEMGHAVTLNYFMSNQQVTLDEALSVLGETASAVTKELLADWAIPIEQSQGPLSFISNCSVAKAQRMIMVYLSDNWFISAEDNFFKNHTELVIGNILKFIDEEGQFQKTALRKFLVQEYQKILSEYNLILDKILNELIANQYQVENKNYNFQEVLQHYKMQHQQATKNFSKKERQSYILARVIKDLAKLNPTVQRYINTSLAELNEVYHYRINQGKATTSDKIYNLLEQKNLYLNTSLDVGVLQNFLSKEQLKLIKKFEQQDLNITQIIKNPDWLKIFGFIFYSLEITSNDQLTGENFITTWQQYAQNYANDYFYFTQQNIISAPIMFSLLFQTIFKLAPESLFKKHFL